MYYICHPISKLYFVCTTWYIKLHERDGLWMQRCSYMIKQLHTVDKGWFFSLGVGLGTNNFSP